MKSNSRVPAVTFYYRKPRFVGNYSVEFIFRDVADRLDGRIKARNAFSRYESNGFFKRLYNCVEAMFRQGDVNHVTGDINFLGLFLRRKKTVQTILDCGHVASATGIKKAVLKYFWLTMPVNRCRYVTAISHATKQEILRYVSCDPGKIIVIPVAISPAFRPVMKTFATDNPRLLQIGAAFNKNIPRLIEAIEGIPCTLVIVGKRIAEYEQLMTGKQIRYEYLSGLSDEAMRREYEKADLVTLASTYEGFGMPILEAQAVGRAVLTSNLLSMPEVAGDGACLVDPLDPAAIRAGITRLISDESYRNTLIKNGFDNVRRYDPDRIAEDYLAVYKKID